MIVKKSILKVQEYEQVIILFIILKIESVSIKEYKLQGNLLIYEIKREIN